MEDNLYQTPATFDDPPVLTSAEAMRREHIGREATIQTLGLLYYLGAVFVLLGSLLFVFTTGWGRVFPKVLWFNIGFGIFVLAIGFGLRRLLPWARVCAVVLAVFGLLAFPLGTVVNILVLIALLTPKARIVFSSEYKEIIAATPYVKIKTSKVTWIVLILLLVVCAVGIGLTWFEAR